MHDAGISPPPEVMVGKAEEVMAGLQGEEFLVLDFRGKDFLQVLKRARLSQRGTVVVGINVCERSFPLDAFAFPPTGPPLKCSCSGRARRDPLLAIGESEFCAAPKVLLLGPNMLGPKMLEPNGLVKKGSSKGSLPSKAENQLRSPMPPKTPRFPNIHETTLKVDR
ncbi:Protein of unknown function DUF1442 [Dillenia turbinata]|uniref:Uncharacterized protein n=1 Tax=Dillenia turbinata TaxID=194707 RepID=A0AAN8V0D4_9MAGN